MAGYERAQQAVIGMAQEVLRPYMEDKSHTQQVGEALRNTLLDLPGPREAVGGSSLLQIPQHAGPGFHVMSGRYSTASRATVP